MRTKTIRTIENYPPKYPNETIHLNYGLTEEKLEELDWPTHSSAFAIEFEDGTVTSPVHHQVANPPCAPGQNIKRHAADPGKRVLRIAVWG